MNKNRKIINGQFPVIIIMAFIGLIFVVLQLYAYISWIFSENFTPVSRGNDPIPLYSLISIRTFEVLSVIVLVISIIWFVKGIVKSNKLDSVRLMMIGWLSAYWLDPFLNYLKPMFTYNAYLVNMGSWANFIPGFMNSGGGRFAEPLLVDPANYFVTFTSTVLAGVAFMKFAKRKWPNINPVVHALTSLPGIWLAMGILDVIAARFFHFDAWLISKWNLSFWGGNFFQFPAYEFLFFPIAFMACSLLLYHADKDGYTFIERGHKKLKLPKWGINAMRILAFVAFCNIANLIYTSTIGYISAKEGDSWPENTPSWLMNEQDRFIRE